MPKLVVTQQGISLREYSLGRERCAIGRHPDSDIFLDDETVSSEHAAVTMAGMPAVVDLDSTNGTFVNGTKISKQPLRHGDVIRIGQHELKFIDEHTEDLASTVVLTPNAAARKMRLRVVNGAKAGSVWELRQERITLGRPGAEVVVVLRTVEGYRLLPVGKRVAGIRVNGAAVSTGGVVLARGDEIAIGPTRLVVEVSTP